MVKVDEIKQQVVIEDILAEQGIYLKRGRCKCPLHGGDNPTSFSVQDGFFHCFACGESGDVISLTQKLYGLNFKEAFRYLANKAGISGIESDKPVNRKSAINKTRNKQNLGKEIEDEVLKLLIRLWEKVLKRLDEDLRDGKIGLSKYYSDQQWVEYQLSKLDELSIFENYHKNRRR